MKCRYILCENEFSPRHSRHVFCSTKCKKYNATKRGTLSNCKHCSKPFEMRHGFHSYCCSLCRHRAQWNRQRNRPERRAKHKEYNEKYRIINRDKVNEKVRRYQFRKKYGIDLEDKSLRIEKQGNKCANPNCSSIGLKLSEWHMDHDHSSGTLRGILCRSCNLILGLARDNPETLIGLADYLRTHAISDLHVTLTKK